MHDHVPEVDQHPAALPAALLVARRNPRLLEFMPQPFHDGTELQGGVRSRKDEVVGEARRLADVQQRNVLSLKLGE